MNEMKANIQNLARDIIIDIGTGSYHNGCELLSSKPRSEHWDKVTPHVSRYPTIVRLEIKKELMRLTNGWKAVHKEREAQR